MKEYIVHVPKHLETNQEKIVSFFGEPIIELIRCKDCIHNVANRQTDPLDTADYSGIDIVCDYFMTDGQEPDDYCSKAEPKEADG